MGDTINFEYHITGLQKVKLTHYSFHYPWVFCFERTFGTKIIFSLLPNILKQKCNIKGFPYLSPSRSKEQYINNILRGVFDISLKDKVIVDVRGNIYLITGIKYLNIECNPQVLSSDIDFLTTEKTRIYYKPVSADKIYRMKDLEITNFFKSGNPFNRARIGNVNEVFINILRFPFD